MIRAQLNILAGYLYEQEVAGSPNLVNNNIQKGKFSSVLQEKFLNICTYFVSDGRFLTLIVDQEVTFLPS